MHNISQHLITELFTKMTLIRVAELVIADEYKKQEIRTPVHFGLGQEGVAVGVCQGLNKNDVVFSHHRSHNHYLAKGGNLDAFIAELYGKELGCCRGRGGSVHLVDKQAGVIATSAILAQMLPVSVGAALAFKMDNLPNVAVGFFGDGALDEGLCYEAFNFAALHHLPVIFVCENNFYSTETKVDNHKLKGTEFIDRTKAFGITSIQADGNNVLETYNVAMQAIEQCRNGNGPVFLELFTYRWLEHVGPNYDHEMNRTYRTQEEVEQWKLNCPLLKLSKYMESNNILDMIQQKNIEQQILNQVTLSIEKAKNSSWPLVEEMMLNVY